MGNVVCMGVKRGLWSVECKVRTVEFKVLSVKCGVWSVECGVKCGVQSVSVNCGV